MLRQGLSQGFVIRKNRFDIPLTAEVIWSPCGASIIVGSYIMTTRRDERDEFNSEDSACYSLRLCTLTVSGRSVHLGSVTSAGRMGSTSEGSSPGCIVEAISKLLTDLVARNDQVCASITRLCTCNI